MRHIENKSLYPLKRLALDFTKKGLTALLEGEKKATVTSTEKYAGDIFSRVDEIDNVFDGLRISLSFIQDEKASHPSYTFAEIHSFHVENYLLRITTVLDRCLKLVGTSLGMTDKVIEAHDGNSSVWKLVSKKEPLVNKRLRKIQKTVKKLKADRNKIAHSKGFSNKNISALNFIEKLPPKEREIFTAKLSLEEHRSFVSQDRDGSYTKIMEELHTQTESLIHCLSSVFTSYISNTKCT